MTDDWMFHNSPKAPRRQPKPGEEVWRLRDPAGRRVQRCEPRDDSRSDAGWDVSLCDRDELLFSRRCGTEKHACYCAEVMKQDTLHHGWVEDVRDASTQ